jgi:urea transport system permease protein
MIAIREDEIAAEASGVPTTYYKILGFTIAAFFAGIAGAIFVNFNGSISPSQMTIAFSINMVIWVAIGGRGTLVGAVIGTFAVNLADYNFSAGAMVEIWPYIMGGIFCITILFFKGGVVGLFREQIPALVSKIKTGVNKKWAKQIPSLK